MRRPAFLLPIIVALGLLASPAAATDLVVQVRTTAGAPVADAVVTVHPASGGDTGPIHFDWPMRMSQQNIEFHPFVLIAPVGAVVAFPNLDNVRHHVYSFSPAHPFELKLYSRDETRTVKFEKAGPVALGCNIHDKMAGFIKVVDTPYAAKTDASGTLVIHGLPPGPAMLHLWRPYLKAPNNEIAKAISIPAAGQAAEGFAVEVHPPAMAHSMY
jgi:plastocyanin